MLALFGVFMDIVLLRRGPRDVPASHGLLLALVAAYLGVGILEARMFVDPWVALVRALIDVGSLLGVFTLLLAVRGRAHRVPQTLSALLGAGLVLAVPDVLAALLALAAETRPGLVVAAHVAWIGLLIWNIAVIGYIVREALEVSALAGLAIGTSYVALMMLVADQLQAAPVA